MMPNGAPEGEVGKRISGFPINLQSLMQWAGMLITLVGFFVYAERRITTIELNARFEGEAVREMREDLKQALRNQERMMREMGEREKPRRAK